MLMSSSSSLVLVFILAPKVTSYEGTTRFIFKLKMAHIDSWFLLLISCVDKVTGLISTWTTGKFLINDMSGIPLLECAAVSDRKSEGS